MWDVIVESSRKAYIKNKRKLDMLTEGAVNLSSHCKVRRVDSMKSIKDKVLCKRYQHSNFLSRQVIY